MNVVYKIAVIGLTLVSCASYSAYAEKAESKELQMLKTKLAIAQMEAVKAKAEVEAVRAKSGNAVGLVGEGRSGYSVKFEGVEETTPPDQIDWKQRSLKGDTGNVTVYVDDDTPTEVYVIGAAPIPTTMVAMRAQQFAHRQAETRAKASFALWMKECFSVSLGTTNKTLVITTGDSEKPGKPIEKSEDRMMTQENAMQTANATWRGMRCWKVFQNGEKSERIEVWRWSVKEQELARIVELLTRDGDPASAKRKSNMEVPSFEL